MSKEKAREIMEEKKCRVYYECWQMDCCGDPFAVGDWIEWTVVKAENLSSIVDLGKVDYFYEAHDEAFFSLQGKVENIFILYQKYEPVTDKTILVPIYGELIKTKRAKDFVADEKGMQASAFLVELSNFIVEPCKSNFC